MNFGSLINHENHQCELNPNKTKIDLHHIGSSRKGQKGHPAWNKGLTKETDERIKNLSLKLLENIKLGKTKYFGRGSTDEIEKQRRLKISETMKKNPLAGGKRTGSGRGKKGWYKGYFCDSSWELAYVIYNLEHNIKFVRNLEGFEYQYENEIHKYYPDFILEDGTYVEVKGYFTKQTEEKIKAFKNKLEIIDKFKIKPYLEYVEEKYGKNFIELYER